MQIRHGKRFAIGTAIGIAASIGGAALAANTRYSPAVGLCQPASPSVYINTAAQYTNDSLTEGQVYCPAISDGDLRASTATSAEVFGWAWTTGGLSAFACNVPFNGGFGQCGPPSTSGAGVQRMGVTTVHADAWSGHPSDFHYIRVELGPKSGSSFNTFWGFGFSVP